MERKEALKDYLASRVITFGKTVDGYDKIFYQTNEDLMDAYLDVDFRDKEVLSVLASGDHVLTADFLDAKKTDAFDRNKLTIYYYYLRIWTIEYCDELYPQVLEGNEWLKELLKKVHPRNEQERFAFNFFRQHVNVNTDMNKMFYDILMQPEGCTLFRKASELTDCLNPELVFYPMNLFEDNHLDSTYDIVLMSNILDWARNDDSKMQIAEENLRKLVRPNGHVICSRLVYKDQKEMEKERRIFEKDFDFEEKSSGYIYIKKNG